MEAYIGTKIILAEPMKEFDFSSKSIGRGQPTDSTTPDRPGYHVQYSNPDGSKYDSWSPKDVFERAYRKVSEDEKELINQ